MRSTRLLAVTTSVLVLGSACGGDDPPTGGGNDAPVANFTAPTNCTAGSVCNFTSTSTDDVGVTTYTWDFDGAGTASNGTTASASFTFSPAGTYPVTLTVGDAEGLTHAVTKDVIVAAGTGNTAPTASFAAPTDCVAGTPCGFASTSTDPDGSIDDAGTDWNFGDTETAEGINVTHTYAAAGTYTVTLNVTDNLGLVNTSPATAQVVVAPAASQDCTTTGTTVACSLTMTASGTVKITLVSEDCELSGNDFYVTAPRFQTVFQNLCNRAPGTEYIVTDADGTTPTVFAAGAPIALRFNQGPQGTNPPVSDPGIQITGSYPTWTLNIDDGGAAGTPGEPDFNDAVITVQAQ